MTRYAAGRKPATMTKCRWCLKECRSMSEWEQTNLAGEWLRLCNPCANRRLRNPWNALLEMRRVGTDG